MKPIMSCMMDIYPILICGSMNGDLHFVKSSCLYSDPDFLLLDNLPKKKMCLSKSYPSHISFVDQIELYTAKDKNKKDLFTTGLSDEAILKWRLDEESPYWDVDNLDHDIDQIDVFSEMIPEDKFNNLMTELLPLREEINDIQNNVEESTEPEYEIYLGFFKLLNIIFFFFFFKIF